MSLDGTEGGEGVRIASPTRGRPAPRHLGPVVGKHCLTRSKVGRTLFPEARRDDSGAAHQY